MITPELNLLQSDLTERISQGDSSPGCENHAFLVISPFADLEGNSGHNTKFIYRRALMLNLISVWMGYYWALYNELFYHIIGPYGISSSHDWIHGSINSIFFLGAIIGSLMVKILPYNGNKIKYFIWLDLVGILCILIAVIPNIWCL
jgi:hypothetical protein